MEKRSRLSKCCSWLALFRVQNRKPVQVEKALLKYEISGMVISLSDVISIPRR